MRKPTKREIEAIIALIVTVIFSGITIFLLFQKWADSL